MKVPEKISLYIIFIMTAALFWVAFNQYFVGDDYYWIYNAEYAMNHASGWIYAFFRMNYSGFYRPITQNVFFFAMYNLFGMHPYPYHLVSFVVYLGTGFLIYKTINHIVGNNLPSLAGSAFYLFSDVNYAGLSWLSAFSQIGSSFLYVATIYSYIINRKRLSYFLYIACLMSGEITSTIPAAAALYEIVINRSYVFYAIKKSIILWYIFIFYMLLRFFAIGISATGYFRPSTNVSQTFALFIKSLILLSGWTQQLSVSFNHIGWNDIALVSVLILIAILLLSLISAIKRQKIVVVVFGASLFVISMLPVLLFTKNNFARYTLAIPLFFISIAISGLLASYKNEKTKNLISTVLIVDLFILSLCSIYNPAGNNYTQGQNIAGQAARFFRNSIESCEMIRGNFNTIYVVDENRNIIPWIFGDQAEARLVTQRNINTIYIGNHIRQKKFPEVIIGSHGNKLMTCGELR